LTQESIKKLAQNSSLGLLCGRFEGIDQRVLDAWDIDEVSIGDFILTGGEIAAMALIDACVRCLPGVIGSSESLEEESFSNFLLEYPHYTRPRVWEGIEVPQVLVQGHHAEIRQWRYSQAEELTRIRRPDLWKRYCKMREQKKG
jgi:tRNA (guanine37-N1)-methyltransferase